MARKEYDKKSRMINSAIDIVGGLQDSLNTDTGELALNLERLYDYMLRRLFEANARNDEAILDEVAGLLSQIKSSWDAIRDEATAQNRPGK